MTKTFNTGISGQCNHDQKNVLVVVTLTGYSSIECFGRGYIDRIFQYLMFWSRLYWQGIPVLNVLFIITLTGYSSIECFGTMTKTFNTRISCQCNHDQNIKYWNILSNVTMTKTFNTGISCKCNHDVVTLTVFQYGMFWSWLHWQGIPVLNVLVMVTLTEYSSIVCHGYIILEYPVKCNHDQNIQYWNIL
jgi:hypothetical protein